MKEFYVRLHQHEDDEYKEIWITKDKRYFARETLDSGKWYFLSDPDGFSEIYMICPEDYLFHVCDRKFHELFTTTNADDSSNFPCLRILHEQAWKNYAESNSIAFTKEKGYNIWTVVNWLATFKDPLLYGEVADDYDLNWAGLKEAVASEPLALFDFAGETYGLVKTYLRHKICGVEWDEYECAGIPVGADFDKSNTGTMYTRDEAEDRVNAMLNKEYPNAEEDYSCGKHTLISVRVSGEWQVGERMDMKQAVHRILSDYDTKKINYHREFVDRVIEREREHHTFFANHDEVKKIYPACEKVYKIYI